MTAVARCLEAAREYLRLGWHPIPCAPRSKRPLVEWKRYQDEAPHPDEIETWFSQWPDANVALVLGRGTFAVDLDGGHEAQRLLFDRGVLLPGAPRSRTAHGFHVFLSASGPVPDRVGLLTTHGHKPQVDIRGVGIVVAPPSVHPDGPVYEWEIPLSLPLPAAPPELLRLIELGNPASPQSTAIMAGSSWVVDALAGVGEGMRDVTCTRLAGFLLGHGFDAVTAEAMLLHGFAQNCSPPLDRETVRKCVRSIDRKEAVTGARDRACSPVPLARVLDDLEASWTRPAPLLTRTPYARLNRYLSGGFSPGDLVYLGARPGVGKTAMALAVARTVAADGLGVVVVSREMLNLALARRLLAQASQVPAHDLKKTRMLDLEQRAAITTSLRSLRSLPIWLTDEAVSLAEIVDMVTAFEVQHRLGLLIIDYLQLIRAPREVRERRLQVEAVSQALKTLALTLKMPVLCLSSLSRPGKEQTGRRPTLDDLRESGELEHDADIVLFLHRKPMEPETECIVAKNRDGAVGLIRMRFTAETLTFIETIP